MVEFNGVVSGNTVRAKHIGRDIMARLKNIVGGELVGYTELLQDSRQEATDRMIEQARERGYDAIFNVRLATSRLANSARDGNGAAGVEMLAFGTAVKLRSRFEPRAERF
jgi:uncharacterized protein YbjQ (UPF0145 family)